LGTTPEFRNKGIESVFVVKQIDLLNEKNYDNVYLSWIGDFNHKILILIDFL